MLVYSSSAQDNIQLDELMARQNPIHRTENACLSRSPQPQRLFFNRLFAFTALISINACTYFAAQALLQA